MPALVWLLGLASLLNDLSSEALFPLLPLFVTAVPALAAAAAVVTLGALRSASRAR